MSSGELISERPRAGIARLTINRPAHRNALTPELRESLRVELQALMQDETVRAVVLTGSNGQFCAGGDLARLAALPKDEVTALLRSGHALIRVLIESPKPVVAAIAGSAAGGGAGLALACDAVLMANSARLILPFDRIGLVPDYGLAYTLARRMGISRAHLLMLSPKPVTATQALAYGLADQVVPDADLEETAIELATNFARQSLLATAWIKKLALAQSPPIQSTLDIELAAQAECFRSDEFQAGVAAFLSKTTLKP
jgi:2-(1,2-epoxy-1,2-dihydrophenyl)acetyl-CoA isomerase